LLKGSQSVIPKQEETIGIRKDNPDRQGFGPSEQEEKHLRKAGRDILRELEGQEAFQALKENINMQLTSEGLRIILNECEDSPAFFEPGSAKLLKKSATILMTIARELGELPNRLVIEGHTDAAFMGSGAYSNWELSADRANAARQLLEVSGLREDQVREVRGYADQYPMVLHDPADHRNRRVTIVVLYRSRDAQYDQLEVGADLMAEIED
jgi:chemotaxis protein MotB